MRERIKQLLSEASSYVFEHQFEVSENPQPIADAIQEKFAELIIKECANFVDENLSETGFGQADGWIRSRLLRLAKNHRKTSKSTNVYASRSILKNRTSMKAFVLARRNRTKNHVRLARQHNGDQLKEHFGIK